MLQTLSPWLAFRRRTSDIVMFVFTTGLGDLFLLGARLVAAVMLLSLEFCFWLFGRWIATSGNYMPKFMVHSSWDDALFLHWEVGVKELQALLPAGLEPDLWGGKAYVGLVLLTERGIHPALFPRLSASWLSITHLAANVRTYVRPKGDPYATPGVHFFSLDASSWLASAGASILFGLPYHPACMERTWGPMMKHRCRFSSRRWSRSTSTHSKPLDIYFEVLPDAASPTLSNMHDSETSHGQQAHQDLPPVASFFVERYCLYHRLPFRSGVSRGRIAHAPWDLSPRGARLLNTAGIGQLIESACPGLRPVPAFGSNTAHELSSTGSNSSCYRTATKEKSSSVAGIWDAVAPRYVHFGSVNSQINFRMFEAVRSCTHHICSRNAAMTDARPPKSNVCSADARNTIP